LPITISERKYDLRLDSRRIDQLRKQWQTYVNAIPPYPGSFSGMGIVMCAGGVTYLTCAWVNISMLRKSGCTLPIEVWYSGMELNDEAIDRLKELNVECRNCKDYSEFNITGYMMKPFAILNSGFREVLLLDADNSCVTDPTFLFNSREYRENNAIFWPDFGITDRESPIWRITGTDDYESIEQESGQILINKEICWKELNLCWHFAMQREDYYKMLWGDKDTFRFSWKAMGTSFYMIPTPVGLCGFNRPGTGFVGVSLVQHDFIGNILFLHRSFFKWDVTGNSECMHFEIRRFKPGTKQRETKFNFFSIGNYKFMCIDMVGEVETVRFRELLGDHELKCLNELKKLRESGFYSRFLQHSYFIYFRPGYADGIMDPLVSQKMERQV
jgi:alpha 1,2-mannosyltransferase